MIIVPTILTAEIAEARKWMEEVVRLEKFSRVQYDFIDGEYTNNLTIRPQEADLKQYPGMNFDAHIMVIEKNVERYVQASKNAGFDRIIVQMESVSRPEDYAGLALDIHSPVTAIEPYLPKLEIVVMMAIEPGFGGQEFDHEVIKKVERLRELKEQHEYRYKIQVDGGVRREYLKELEEAGADEVTVGVGRVWRE
jgi:ribulose-phosphate 3-epimerase